MTDAKQISPTICVDDPTAGRDFYVQYFNAKVVFDAGWYINVGIGKGELCFMKPQRPDQPLFSGEGLMYNLEVEDVDSEHQRLTGLGLAAVMPLEDHPWGDRGFSVVDPNGIALYIYTPREPSPEFKQYYK
ncbi:MAG: VOC family protein [gamma proteobacterium endosymbiont of Lamellibrachia anaximandri]|nr:VOC family protein [gamma proteobacterium endosymbiont of Lamellibrachia anaximandri]MBL3533701.1 VOC family protein [gamma proteobacterium endosymbiont of Lamellibrachia anaximandri]